MKIVSALLRSNSSAVGLATVSILWEKAIHNASFIEVYSILGVVEFIADPFYSSYKGSLVVADRSEVVSKIHCFLETSFGLLSKTIFRRRNDFERCWSRLYAVSADAKVRVIFSQSASAWAGRLTSLDPAVGREG